MNMNETYKGDKKLLIGVAFSIATHWMLTQSLMVTIPYIKESIQITDSWANFSVGVSGLIAGCFLVLTGSLADYFGRIKFIKIGLIFNIIGSLCLILTQRQSLFLIGRVLQGLAAAFILSSTLAVAKTYFEGSKRQEAISFIVMASFTSTALCTFIGGWISYFLGWKTIFILSIIISFISFLLILKVPEKNKKQGKYSIDFLGITLFIILMVSLNIITSRMSLLSIPLILGFFITFFIGGYYFIKLEKKKKDSAFLDLSIFRIKEYKTSFIVNFFVNLGIGFIIMANIYLKEGKGLNTMQIGLVSVGHGIGILMSVRLGERLLKKYGVKYPAGLGLFIAILGFAISTLTHIDTPLYLGIISISFLLLGIGLGLQATPISDNAMSHVPLEKASISGAMIQGGSSLGSSFGIGICISLFTYLSKIYMIDKAAQITFILTTLFYGLGFFYILWFIPSGKKTLS